MCVSYCECGLGMAVHSLQRDAFRRLRMVRTADFAGRWILPSLRALELTTPFLLDTEKR
jgi:hypothetical protein